MFMEDKNKELRTITQHRPNTIWGKFSAQVHPGVLRLGANIVLFFGKFVIVGDAGMDK